MSEEKQIEKMAKDLQKSEHWYFNDHSVDFELDRKKTAENLYNAGYRKQEWISVEERLPDLETARTDGHHIPKSVRVLCACKQRSGKVFVKEGYYELFSNKPCWRIPGSIDSVTHWMPLPEAPKKGNEE